MKSLNIKFLVIALVGAMLMTSPTFLLAQGAPTGQLVVSGNNFKTQGNFVTVNNENSLSGRTVFSPAKIVTSPEANAKVILTKLGSTILFSPNSTMNLSFDNESITGDISSGKITIQNIGQTKINLTTPGGAVIFSSQPTSIEISVINGKTVVRTDDGEVSYNGNRIAAGQNSGGTPNSSAPSAGQTAASSGPNYLLIGGIVAAVAAAVVIGVVIANNDDDNSTVVSPTT